MRLAKGILGAGFARDAAVLTVGTAAGQALNLIVSPILSRLYNPAQIGALGVVVALFDVVMPLACWRYEQSIMLASDEEAAPLLLLSLLITLFMLALSGVVFAIFGRAIILAWPSAGNWLFVIPFLLLIAGVYQTLRMWLSRSRRFANIAAAKMSRNTVANGAEVGCGWLVGASASLLVFSYLLGPLIEIVVLSFTALRAAAPALDVRVTFQQLKAAARRYRRFPAFTMPASLLNLLAIEAPTLLLAATFPPTEVGLYWLSFRTLALPTALLGEAVSTVFYQRMASLRAECRPTAPLVTQVFVALLGLALIPMIIIFIGAPSLFHFVYGAEWTRAGYYARALVPARLGAFIAYPLLRSFSIFEKQHVEMWWNLVFLAVSVTAFGLGSRVGPLRAVELYSVGSAVLYGWIIYAAFKCAGGSVRDIPGHLRQGIHFRLNGS